MNGEISTVIIDDNAGSLKCLRNALSGYSGIRISGMAQRGDEGKKLLFEKRPELLFLDIELPDTTGLELLREIRSRISWKMQVIFYTAYDKYLLEALRESAFDYLLKPFEKNELDQVMARFFNLNTGKDHSLSFGDSLTRILPDHSTFLIATVDGFQILRLEQIGYFRYMKDRKLWLVALTDNKELQLKRNSNAQTILQYSPSFVQINRDQIININFLSRVKGNECLLFPPFDHVNDLKASGGFIRMLQDKFSQI